MITRDGILGWDFVIDGKLGKAELVDAVSTTINVVIKRDGLLGCNIVINGRLVKD